MIRVLALIKERDKLLGLRLFDENSKSIGDYNLQEASKFLQTYGCSNAKIVNGTLESTECSIGRFPVLNTQLQLTTPGGVFIIAQGTYNKQLFYDIVNVDGSVKRLSESTLIKYVNTEDKKYKSAGITTPVLVNAKLVDKGDKVIVSAIKGKFKEIQVEELRKHYEQKPRINGIPMSSLRKRQQSVECFKQGIKEAFAFCNASYFEELGYDSKNWKSSIKEIIKKCSLWELRTHFAEKRYPSPDEGWFKGGSQGDLDSYNFIHNEIGRRYCETLGSSTIGGKAYYWVRHADKEGYNGLADARTGSIVLPCWFDWIDDSPFECYEDRYILVSYDTANKPKCFGLVDLRTRKVTKMAYEDCKSSAMDTFKFRNIDTGKFVDIRKELEHSTETLDDLLKYVPEFWRIPLYCRGVQYKGTLRRD